MQYLRVHLKVLAIASLIIFLSGFTGFSEKVPPPKDVPKRTEDKKAGIVIPAFDASPYDIIEKSYDYLSGLMLYPEEGIFKALLSELDFKPHKLTFHHKKFGFVAFKAYRVSVCFMDTKKPQKMFNFGFSPFEITEPKPEKDVIAIAESWVEFFDSLGWKRAKKNPNYPYGLIPKHGNSFSGGNWPYMEWETDGLKLSVNICLYDTRIGKPDLFYITIVFENPSAGELIKYKKLSKK